MTVNWSNYSLAELRAYKIDCFREGGGSRPDVLLLEINNEKAVLKDHNACDQLFRVLFGRLLRWRECKALKQLHDIPAIPILLSEPDPRSFLMQYKDAKQSNRVPPDQVDWAEFFNKLSDAIALLHHAGIAHNDLRNASNILIDPKGNPVLVDLVACFFRGQKWNVINLWLFDKFSQVDLSAIGKLKQRVAPELVCETDIQTVDIAGRFGLFAKQLGKLIRRLSRKLFTH